MTKKILFITLLILVTNALAEVAVTVYNHDLGVVREMREMRFEKGKQILQFTNVASRIDPTSVHFKL